MSSLDNYTDEELGRMLRHAAEEAGYEAREKVTTMEAFCSWLELIGLSPIAHAIKIGIWAWSRVKSFWKSIFS